MDILDLFKLKNSTTKLDFKSVKDLFQEDANKNKLTQIIYYQLNTTNNDDVFNNIKSKVGTFIDSWINLGKLDNLTECADVPVDCPNLQLSYYNKLFIETFRNEFVQYNDMKYEIDNNPYKQIITPVGDEAKLYHNNKSFKISDMIASDYENINTNNYNDTFATSNLFNAKYNKIKWYEKGIYSKNVDFKDEGSTRTYKSMQNYNNKRYDNSELLTNVSYLNIKKESH